MVTRLDLEADACRRPTGIARSSRFRIASKQIGQQMSAPSESPMCRVTCAMR